MWNRDNFVFLVSQLLLIKKVKVGEGGGGGACLILWPMVGNFFGDQAAGVLHIQMKYRRIIFFFLILEMVTFAKPTNQMCLK